MIVAIDLVAAETGSPFVLRRAIAKAKSKDELSAIASRLNSTVVALHRAELAPVQVSELTSARRRRGDRADDRAGGSRPRALHRPSSAGCRSAATADASLTLVGRGLRDGVEGHPRERPPPSQAQRTLASTRISEYMRGLADHVADCVRVIGWRLDPHGVTASERLLGQLDRGLGAVDRSWLSRPSDNQGPDRHLDPARWPHRLRPPAGLDVKELLFETGDRPTLERWMLKLALAAKPPTGFRHDIVVEDSGAQKGTFDIKQRRPASDRRPGPLRRAEGRCARHPHPGSTPARGGRGRARCDRGCGCSRRPSSCSAIFASSTRSNRSSRAGARTTPRPRTGSIRSPGDTCGMRSGRSPMCSEVQRRPLTR